MMNRYAMVAVTCLLGAACSNKPAVTADEVQQEDAEQQRHQEAERQRLANEQAAEAVDLNADQTKAQADQKADQEKAAIDAETDKVKFEAELKARLEKADIRLQALTPMIAKATPASKTKANEILKQVKEQRVVLGNRLADLETVTKQGWPTTKSELDSKANTLESNIDEIEKLVSA